MANLINAYNQTTRVSFYRRDIGDQSVYKEHYDIVLAFSVFTYIDSVLDKIAAITDTMLVLETHKLEGNLESSYLSPILPVFPHFTILGYSDWGSGFDCNERRAVIAFAKGEWALVARVQIR